MTEKQTLYLAELARTGSYVKARKAAGVRMSSTVAGWRAADETFAAAEEDAMAAARDEVVQRSRELALAGNESQLSLWMRIAHAELRPANTVQVGVQVNAAERRLAQLSDDELLARGEQIIRDARLRGEQPRGGVIDAEVLPTPPDALEAPAGAEIRPEDLL